MLEALARLAGSVDINPRPAAFVPAEVQASYRGARRRSTGGGAPLDLAVSFCFRRQTDPSSDFIFRNSGDVQQIEIGWWPGDRDYDRPALFAFSYRVPFAYPVPDGFGEADLKPDAVLGPSLARLWSNWEDIGSAEDPRALALEFAHSAFRHPSTCRECDPILAASAEGSPPPVE